MNQQMKPHDFGYSDAELKAMSIDQRNEVLARLTGEMPVVHPDDDMSAYLCPKTPSGEHDWSDESYSADPAARTFRVCVACGMRYLDYLA